MKSTASCDSLIEGERRDKTSTAPCPPASFSFKEAPHPSVQSVRRKTRVNFADRNKAKRNTGREKRRRKRERRRRGGGGGGGTIRSGRPLMLSICPHLGCDTTHRSTSCILPHGTLYCSLSFVHTREYRGVCRVCTFELDALTVLKWYRHFASNKCFRY